MHVDFAQGVLNQVRLLTRVIELGCVGAARSNLEVASVILYCDCSLRHWPETLTFHLFQSLEMRIHRLDEL
jgi:hypothetical protein